MTRGGQAATGELKKTAVGWAIRFRDAHGSRRQRGGFRTKADAKLALDEELRKVALGTLYRPNATLRELVDTYMEQYDAAPSSHAWMEHALGKSLERFADRPIGSLEALDVARWRNGLPEKSRQGAHRALRQVLEAAVRWGWVERNVATAVKNPMHPREEFTPFASWEDVEAVAVELGSVFGPWAIFSVGTGVRPEEAFGANWADVDLEARTFTVQRAYAKGRLKPYPKTVRSRRKIPLRGKVVEALELLPRTEDVLFPAPGGGRVDVNNIRSRTWAPAFEAAGVERRRIYDMRHTFATWSLAANMSIFTLARRMGTSVAMIDRTYGHLAHDAEDHDRDLLDAYDAAAEAKADTGHVAGTESGDDAAETSAAA